ncbi:MAG: hypothetical protein LBL83_12440 [Clostridiales bacterium]|nr:hypothetical protein [Clostridiales bacterium]
MTNETIAIVYDGRYGGSGSCGESGDPRFRDGLRRVCGTPPAAMLCGALLESGVSRCLIVTRGKGAPLAEYIAERLGERLAGANADVRVCSISDGPRESAPSFFDSLALFCGDDSAGPPGNKPARKSRSRPGSPPAPQKRLLVLDADMPLISSESIVSLLDGNSAGGDAATIISNALQGAQDAHGATRDSRESRGASHGAQGAQGAAHDAGALPDTAAPAEAAEALAPADTVAPSEAVAPNESAATPSIHAGVYRLAPGALAVARAALAAAGAGDAGSAASAAGRGATTAKNGADVAGVVFAALAASTGAASAPDAEAALGGLLRLLLASAAKIGFFCAEDESECLRLSDHAQGAVISSILWERKSMSLMRDFGVVVMDPAHTYIDQDVEVGESAIVYPGCILEGDVRIGKNAVIGPYARIKDSTVGDGATVDSSVVVSASVAGGATVGPFAYLRPGADLRDGAKVGSFVEIKNSAVGAGTKIPHLSYVGDADVGAGTNIGCGVITCNYDGKSKHRTKIGSGVFVGSNSNLVAPVEIADGAYVASGSTITDDVPEDALAIARGRQAIKEHWVSKKGLSRLRKP